MRLIPSDPDIETLLRRIERRQLDLQPDFQRGEVWSPKKRQLLVDSILRGWHVPPIHVVETDEGEEVLDGQQRLVAIRDFHQGRLKVFGDAEPRSEEIEALGGLTFHELPEPVRRRFLGFGIRFFTIVDYSIEEPAELFYRLNQPVTLTSPEQRNAFFGPVRDQVRELVHQYHGTALDKEFLGFSNSRMAWDDVLSRLCYVLEAGGLRSKVTAPRLASRYRNPEGFPDEAIRGAHGALEVLSRARIHIPSAIRFNKATLFSWLYFLARARGFEEEPGDLVAEFIAAVEVPRQRLRHEPPHSDPGRLPDELTARLIALLHDRASSRVGDVSSVLARDFVLWAMLHSFWPVLGFDQVAERNGSRLEMVQSVCDRLPNLSLEPVHPQDDSDPIGELTSFEDHLERLLTEVGWEAPQ